MNPVPLSVFRFSPTLRVLSICCRDSRFEFCTLNFPRLEQLTLKGVSGISESTIHGILSRCLFLQSLVLQCNVGCRHLRISSPTLRSLGISDGYRQEGKLEEVIVEDAPLLERLIPDGLMYGLKIRVVQAPKLKIIGYLGDSISEFQSSFRVFKVAAATYSSLCISM
jgi:hypothetical protein